jgi:hypothetical protein
MYSLDEKKKKRGKMYKNSGEGPTINLKSEGCG